MKILKTIDYTYFLNGFVLEILRDSLFMRSVCMNIYIYIYTSKRGGNFLNNS